MTFTASHTNSQRGFVFLFAGFGFEFEVGEKEGS
jgi:hypothetical protein